MTPRRCAVRRCRNAMPPTANRSDSISSAARVCTSSKCPRSRTYVYHLTRNPSLARVRLARLRPTQLTVGYVEVTLKAQEWARLAGKPRKLELEQHVFPAVLGPGSEYFIVDHHHLGIALIDEGIKDVFVTVLDD